MYICTSSTITWLPSLLDFFPQSVGRTVEARNPKQRIAAGIENEIGIRVSTVTQNKVHIKSSQLP